MEDRIAILLGTYNGEKYIKQQLDSLLEQTYKNFICYIHDDGSTDNTLDIINEYIHKYPNVFCQLKYESTHNACKNFLSMLKYAKEEYIAFCDQDDVWKPNKLEISISYLKKIEKESNFSPSLVFSNLEVVDSELNTIDKSFFNYSNLHPDRYDIRSLMIDNCAPGCTIMINRALAKLAVCYKNSDEISMHDTWCMMLASTFGKIGYINEATMFYRQHENNVIGVKKRSFLMILKEILLGKRLEAIHNRTVKVRGNFKQLLELIPQDDKSKTAEFVRKVNYMNSKGKIYRMKFYYKYKLFKNSGLLTILCC